MANIRTIAGRVSDEARKQGIRRRVVPQGGVGGVLRAVTEHEKRRPEGRALGFAKRQPMTAPFMPPRPFAPPMVLAPNFRTPQAPPLIDVMTGRISSPMANTLPATIRRPPNVPANYALGDDDDDFAQFGGFSLKSIGHALTNVGHAIGTAVTSKVGQGILGGALALTGVGAPAAAAIFATTKGVGNLIKPGGNIKHFVTGAAQGAIEGVASNLVGKAGRAVVSHFTAGNAATVASKVAPKVLGGGGAAGGTTVVGGGDTGIAPFTVNDAAMQAAITDAALHAENAGSAVAQQQQQVGGTQAQLAQAMASGNDVAAQQLMAQLAESQQQLAIAQQAAQQAQTAATTLQQSGGGLSGQQVAGLVGSAAAGSAAAQVAAAAQPTPDGTAAAAQAADVAAGQQMDASGDTTAPSGLMAHPLLLIGGLAAVVLIAGRKKRKRTAQAA